jgi:sulfur relay (sulfurtransferase) DsrF/TusC family protein
MQKRWQMSLNALVVSLGSFLRFVTLIVDGVVSVLSGQVSSKPV